MWQRTVKGNQTGEDTPLKPTYILGCSQELDPRSPNDQSRVLPLPPSPFLPGLNSHLSQPRHLNKIYSRHGSWFNLDCLTSTFSTPCKGEMRRLLFLNPLRACWDSYWDITPLSTQLACRGTHYPTALFSAFEKLMLHDNILLV